MYAISSSSAAAAAAAVDSSSYIYAFLFGSLSEFAYYFVDLQVGTPRQRQSVILDTGSSLLGFPCKGCSACGEHADFRFDLDASLSGEWLHCSSPKCQSFCSPQRRNRCFYSQRYSEGSSIEGYFVSDEVTIGEAFQNNPTVRYDHIGCHMIETKLFVTQKASGIIGVSSPSQINGTLIDKLFKFVKHKQFSICLAEEGGLLTIGQDSDLTYVIPDSTGNKQPIWVPILSPSSYKVGLTGVEINGVRAGYATTDFGTAVVDSGTTYTYFPHWIYSTLDGELQKLCKPEHDCIVNHEKRFCWKIPDFSNFPKFLPTMKVYFGNVVIDWRPESYLYHQDKNYWCVGLDQESSINTVLGMSFFKQKRITFQRDTRKIGFVEANCPTHLASNRPPGPGEAEMERPLPAKEVFPEFKVEPTKRIYLHGFFLWSGFLVGIGFILSSMIVIIFQSIGQRDVVQSVESGLEHAASTSRVVSSQRERTEAERSGRATEMTGLQREPREIQQIDVTLADGRSSISRSSSVASSDVSHASDYMSSSLSSNDENSA